MFHMDSSGSWSLGVLIGLPLLAVTVLALAAGGVYLVRKSRDADDYIDAPLLKWGGVVAVVAAVVTAVLTLVGMYPFGAEYHQYRDVSGTVGKLDSRLISTGSNDTQTKFVVRFQGSPLQFGCDDTRCAQVAEGDSLTLSCKRAWQYAGTDGYDCRFVSTEAATR